MLSFDRYMVCFYFYYNDVKMQICKNNIYIVYNTNIYYIMDTIFNKTENTSKEHKEKQKENIKNSVFKKIKDFLDSNYIDTGKKPNIENDEVFGKINQKLKDFGFSQFKTYVPLFPIDNTGIDASNKLEGITNKLKKITNKLLKLDNEFYESALIRPLSNEVIGFLKDKIIQIANTKLRDTLAETVKEDIDYEEDFEEEEEPKNQALLNNLIPIAVKNLKDMLDKRREEIEHEGDTYEEDFEEDEDIIEEKINYIDAFKVNLTEIAKTNLKVLFDSNLKRIKDLKNALEGVVYVVKPPIEIGDIVVFKPNEQDKWYIGEITMVNDDGTYNIKVDRRIYNNVPSHRVVGVKYIIGCKAKYNGITCKITGVNNNRTVTIQYDDDDKVEDNISGDDIIIEEKDILNILENNIPGLSLLLHKSSEKIKELTNMIVQLERANEQVIQNQQELKKVNKTLSKKQGELEEINKELKENQDKLEDANQTLSKKQSELEQVNKELSDNQNNLINEMNRLNPNQFELNNEMNQLKSSQFELNNEMNQLKSNQNELNNEMNQLKRNQNELRNELRNEVKYNETILSDKIHIKVYEIYHDLQQITYKLHDELKTELKEELKKELNKIDDIDRQYINLLNRIINTNNNPPLNDITQPLTEELIAITQQLTEKLKNLEEELKKLKKDRNTMLGNKLSTLASNMLKRKLDSIVNNKNNLVNQNTQLKKQVELLLEAQTLFPHVLLSIYQQELTQKETELKKAIKENENKLNKSNQQSTQIDKLKKNIDILNQNITALQNEMNQLKSKVAELEKEKLKNSLANILKKIAMTNLISVLNKPMPIEDGDVVMTEYYNDNENKQNKIESIKVF